MTDRALESTSPTPTPTTWTEWRNNLNGLGCFHFGASPSSLVFPSLVFKRVREESFDTASGSLSERKWGGQHDAYTPVSANRDPTPTSTSTSTSQAHLHHPCPSGGRYCRHRNHASGAFALFPPPPSRPSTSSSPFFSSPLPAVPVTTQNSSTTTPEAPTTSATARFSAGRTSSSSTSDNNARSGSASAAAVWDTAGRQRGGEGEKVGCALGESCSLSHSAQGWEAVTASSPSSSWCWGGEGGKDAGENSGGGETKTTEEEEEDDRHSSSGGWVAGSSRSVLPVGDEETLSNHMNETQKKERAFSSSSSLSSPSSPPSSFQFSSPLSLVWVEGGRKGGEVSYATGVRHHTRHKSAPVVLEILSLAQPRTPFSSSSSWRSGGATLMSSSCLPSCAKAKRYFHLQFIFQHFFNEKANFNLAWARNSRRNRSREEQDDGTNHPHPHRHPHDGGWECVEVLTTRATPCFPARSPSPPHTILAFPLLPHSSSSGTSSHCSFSSSSPTSSLGASQGQYFTLQPQNCFYYEASQTTRCSSPFSSLVSSSSSSPPPPPHPYPQEHPHYYHGGVSKGVAWNNNPFAWQSIIEGIIQTCVEDEKEDWRGGGENQWKTRRNIELKWGEEEENTRSNIVRNLHPHPSDEDGVNNGSVDDDGEEEEEEGHTLRMVGRSIPIPSEKGERRRGGGEEKEERVQHESESRMRRSITTGKVEVQEAAGASPPPPQWRPDTEEGNYRLSPSASLVRRKQHEQRHRFRDNEEEEEEEAAEGGGRGLRSALMSRERIDERNPMRQSERRSPPPPPPSPNVVDCSPSINRNMRMTFPPPREPVPVPSGFTMLYRGKNLSSAEGQERLLTDLRVSCGVIERELEKRGGETAVEEEVVVIEADEESRPGMPGKGPLCGRGQSTPCTPHPAPTPTTAAVPPPSLWPGLPPASSLFFSSTPPLIPVTATHHPSTLTTTSSPSSSLRHCPLLRVYLRRNY